ncbi:adhesion G-protein coupled receptor G2-like isoform X2 [Octopus sinensis]|uniref:Adhesion G-protein coupled receptor G2-like isoform X2 n=1 Tax=Octopus sinensis TaxID=2607531 RepID=A0A6P7SPB1_9MOLL|nr:adhesion G-protein coupled receptor G2-like isoform X2 [Octopus sinensis]
MSSKILVNLCISLAITNIIFLAGMQPYALKVSAACKAVAALLHYFLLASLMWMAVEACHVCLVSVIVFKTYQSHFILKSSILSWGLPAVIVTITLAINYTNNYIRIEHAQVCWLSEIPFYAAFLAPVGTILIFNVIMFFLVILRLIAMQNNKLLQHETRRLRFLGIFGLFFLFGLSWVFAFFAVGEAAEVFQILFVTFSAFQGTFIFLFYCIYKKDTRDIICSCICKQKKEKASKVLRTYKSSGDGTAEMNT